MKSYITSILLLFVLTPIIAQSTISGRVTDDFNAPLPFANIILQQKGNDTFVKGVVSDDTGAYIFENIKNGTYFIEVSVLGFKVKKTEEFELIKNKITNFSLKEEIKIQKINILFKYFTLVINLISAVIAGVFVPLILRSLNQDPAIAGSVVVTTVTDVIGFLSFLGLATIFLI